MLFKQVNAKYDLSVIVVFYNMRREAKRTLYSLTPAYQKNPDNLSYEVIIIDNGSTQPLDKTWVESFGKNFRYIYFDKKTPSPCEALNYGVKTARAGLITVCVDGARIFSPGILHYSMLAARIYKNPFIYTLGMHIGNKPQNYLAEEGYSQHNEDLLLASIAWEQDGYLLFDIASPAISSGNGFFSKLSESNCLTMLRSTYQKMGGFDKRFKSVGGGLANLDFFSRANMIHDINPVMLLGEATFHQFHGGISTNVSRNNHPWGKFSAEYKRIHGKPLTHYFKPPTYMGAVNPKCSRLLNSPDVDSLLNNG